MAFTVTVGDFCKAGTASGAKGTYPAGLYEVSAQITGKAAKRTPWLKFSVPLSGLAGAEPVKVGFVAKAVGDQKMRTVFFLDGIDVLGATKSTCLAAGTAPDCCTPAFACDACKGGACASCFNGDCDGDGVLNVKDNCPTTANAEQANKDGDALGDVCDPSSCIVHMCTGALKQACVQGDKVVGCCKSNDDCQDGDLCTVPTCSTGSCVTKLAAGCCKIQADCNDGKPCTKDECTGGKCKFTWICGS
ncbi:MAG: hypothetical protein EXR79_08175 [Myxococcales bacterium]|nr:hypothetical protein [Myxococcales bacterium]